MLPYAALAHDVYCNDRIARVDDEACRRETGIERWGWALLGQFPTGDMLGGRSRRGLHLAVYYADDGPQRPVRVGVAFKGTDFTSWSDWHSNLRWFLPGRDQYDVVAEIAFDPSPVTGFYGCVPAAEVNCNVPVWRVYERGEVLAWVRSATRQLLPLSENITELELDLLQGSVIANHSMACFYRQLDGTVRPHHVALARPVDLFAPLPATQALMAAWLP